MTFLWLCVSLEKTDWLLLGGQQGTLGKHLLFHNFHCLWFSRVLSFPFLYSIESCLCVCCCWEAGTQIVDLRGRLHGEFSFPWLAWKEEECSLSAPGHHIQSSHHFLKLLTGSSQEYQPKQSTVKYVQCFYALGPKPDLPASPWEFRVITGLSLLLKLAPYSFVGSHY